MTPATGRSVVGQHPLEGREVRRAGRIAVGDERDLLELQAAREVRRQRLAIVRMDAARHEDALAAGRPAGHQGRLGGGRRAVVVRGADDVEVDQLGDQRLVLVDALERALADLGLVRACRPCTTRRAAAAGRRPAASSGGTRRRPGTRRGPSGSGRPGPGAERPAGVRARPAAGPAPRRAARPGCRRRARRRSSGPGPRASARGRWRYGDRTASSGQPAATRSS